MRYVARRAIDRFRPGDEIPEGRYDAETLAKMIAAGKVEAVDSPVANDPVEEAPKASAPRRAEKRPPPRRKP